MAENGHLVRKLFQPEEFDAVCRHQVVSAKTRTSI
jgi:hypothetical protein